MIAFSWLASRRIPPANIGLIRFIFARTITVIVFALVLSARATFAADDAKTLLSKAQAHLAKGRYEEAIETYEQAASAKADADAIALGKSEALQAIGNWDGAERTIAARIAAEGKSPSAMLLARAAELHFARGRIADAEAAAARALKFDPDQPLARLVSADCYAETGRLHEANEGYRWFIRFYNDRQPQDAATLLMVARGSVQYARWNGNTQIFHFVVNTLCPDALKADANAWPAHYLAGGLLLEKYNREQAVPALERALAINPRAAEVLVLLGRDALDQNDFAKADAKADEALEINPKLPAALRLKADVCYLTGRIADARTAAAKAAEINPRDPLTLARIAACDLAEEGLPSAAKLERLLTDPQNSAASLGRGANARFVKLWLDVARSNPKPGKFLIELGRLLEMRRRFDVAEVCYRRAMVVMPQLSESKTSLGMLLMRVGKTDEAHKILDDALRADPYHRRVSNFRKVLKLLDGYQAITTEHFVIRVDSKLDKLLGGYMADYLEGIYPELVKEFGFAPPQRTQFEIYNKTDSISGHEWFSARMVGLPWIQTIGASTGVMVAMASPTAAPAPFNWARVLRHEFVHVITVQQSGFNIPQWFTEALAVLNEGYPPPALWDDLLVERLAKGDLRTLENLDRGFQRPANSDDWQFTYCQSRLYAEYMIERGGRDALHKMLEAYRGNALTPAAIRQVFGVDLAQFEKGYREFLTRKAAGLRRVQRRPSQSVDELERELQAKPEDPAVAGAYAWVLLEAGDTGLARTTAKRALEKNPREPWAAIVLARLDADGQQYAEGAARLESLLDRAHPHREALITLVKLKLLDEKSKEAIDLCELGRKNFPSSPEFVQGLAAAAVQLDDVPRLTAALETLCPMLPDDSVPRKKLTQIAMLQKHYPQAVQYGRSALHVDVLDSDLHREMGEAYLALGDIKKALPELEAADQLKPNDNAIEILLSRALIASARRADAKKHLQAMLARDKTNADVRTLLKSLD